MSKPPVELPAGPLPLIEALAELGLAPPVSAAKIKKAYRERSRFLHPDRNARSDGTNSSDAMARLNAAYRLLSDYTGQFRFQFSVSEFFEQHPRERVRMQFADSDDWGKVPRPKSGRNNK